MDIWSYLKSGAVGCISESGAFTGTHRVDASDFPLQLHGHGGPA